jgi:uncharacterized damage-inducible protein DinB
MKIPKESVSRKESDMSEKANMIDNLKKLQEGDAFHGPSTRDILKDVTAQKAAARPIPGFHTIWELILHIAAWEEAFARRLQDSATEEPDEGDFPPVKETSADAWAQAVRYLETSHEHLLKTIDQLSDAKLQDTVVGKNYSIRFMILGIIQHHVYHAGQIALLKRL